MQLFFKNEVHKIEIFTWYASSKYSIKSVNQFTSCNCSYKDLTIAVCYLAAQPFVLLQPHLISSIRHCQLWVAQSRQVPMCYMHVLSSGIASYGQCSPDRYPCGACMCSHQASILKILEMTCSVHLFTSAPYAVELILKYLQFFPVPKATQIFTKYLTLSPTQAPVGAQG